MFHYFTIKFHFSFFAWHFLLRLDLVIFASKRNEGETFPLQKKQNSIFFALFCFPILFRVKKKHFYRFFRLIFVSLRFFRLIFACFTFVFPSDFWCFASKWIMWNRVFFRSKRKEIFASISNFASEAKVRAHPSPEIRPLLACGHFSDPRVGS